MVQPFPEERLKQMLNLRSCGWSSYALSYKYNCDVESIKELCRIHKPKVRKIFGRGRKLIFPTEAPKPKQEPLPAGKYDNLLYEHINQGHSYQDYVNKDMQRRHANSSKL